MPFNETQQFPYISNRWSTQPGELKFGSSGESVGKYFNLYLINIRYHKIIMLIICLSTVYLDRIYRIFRIFFCLSRRKAKTYIPLRGSSFGYKNRTKKRHERSVTIPSASLAFFSR